MEAFIIESTKGAFESEHEFLERGWGNGYVVVPKGHWLEDVSQYNIDVKVHGGLTFGAKINKSFVEAFNFPKEFIGRKVFGFDTSHFGDNKENWSKDNVQKEAEALAEKLRIGDYTVNWDSLDNLVYAVVKWGEARNFYDTEHGTTSEKQFLKLVEEIGEIGGSLARGRSIKDDIGDSLVVLIGLAKLNNLSIRECLEHAYDEIKDRKGKMVNGVFIKENDLTT